MSAATILLVDDESQIRRVLRTSLAAHGYVVREAASGEQAIEEIRKETPDLLVLDINMPGMGGLEACREIRRNWDLPIIMLSVRNSERDKVGALDAGADDYVVKPFGIQELLARVRATLRRYHHGESSEPAIVNLPDLTIDLEHRTVLRHGERIRLTPKEFELLRHLVMSTGKPLAHRQLLQAVWGPDYGDQVDYLRVFVNQLRKKIEPAPSNPTFLLTEPWVGYRLYLPPR